MERFLIWVKWLLIAAGIALVVVLVIDLMTGPEHQCRARGGHLQAFGCEPAIRTCATSAHGSTSCATYQKCDWQCVPDVR